MFSVEVLLPASLPKFSNYVTYFLKKKSCFAFLLRRFKRMSICGGRSCTGTDRQTLPDYTSFCLSVTIPPYCMPFSFILLTTLLHVWRNEGNLQSEHKVFPDYKHLLQENYVEYKHFFKCNSTEEVFFTTQYTSTCAPFVVRRTSNR